MKKNPLEQQKQPVVSSLAEIPAICKTFTMIAKREQIKDLVEQPLVKACEIFWDKNIETFSSSANQKDIKGGSAYINIYFDSLSKENQKIGQQYGKLQKNLDKNILAIEIPISESTTVDEVSNKAMKIANAFQKQPVTWIPEYTLKKRIDDMQSLKEKYPEEVAKEEERLNQPGEWEKECKESGKYFDTDTQIAYMSEEHYKKAKNID